MKLVVATHNRHKVEELRALLAGVVTEVIGLAEIGELPAPEETGRTFLANATLKALAAGTALGPDLWVLADDSGLEVAALDDAPGVDSALYSGRHGDDAGHRRKLLAELARVGAVTPAQRRARFRCVLVLARGAEIAATAEGAVEGQIADHEQGTGGFGYDSLFIPEGHGASFGELSAEVKNSLSHRARALAALRSHWPEAAV